MNWKKVKLGDVCEFLSGFAWSAKNFKDVGKMPIIRIQNMCSTKPDDFIYWDEKYDEKFIIKTNDLLLSLSGSIKLDYWKGVNALLNQRIVKISTNSSVNDRWFFWQIQNELKRIERMGKWALVNNVSLTDLRNLEIPLPDLTTQQYIAKVLDQADALRQQNRQLLAHYDELLQSTFIDLFGDPVKNEKGWEVKKVETLADIQGGLQVSAESRKNLPLNLPYLRVANVFRGYLDLSEIKTIDLTEGELIRVELKKNDLLIVEGHGNKNEIGRVAIWDGSIKPIVHQNHLIRVRVDSNQILPTFLCFFINSESGKQQLHSASNTTSGLNTISTGKIKNITLPVPHLPLQQHFTQVVEQIEEQKAVVKQSLGESEVLFEGLLAEYFG